MKVGIKKLHENEWQVHIGCASMKLDRFSLALLQITLDHLLALEHGQAHSTLQSYVKLGLRLNELSDRALQIVLSEVDDRALLDLLLLANDKEFTERVLRNTGGILAKQLKEDLDSAVLPDEADAKQAVKHLIEKMFELEAEGNIEFITSETRYI